MAVLFRLQQWQVGRQLTPCDPMAVAVDWLDAYLLDSSDCWNVQLEWACGGSKIIHGQEGIAAYWRRLVR